MSEPTHYVIPADWWDDFGLSDVIRECRAQGETSDGEAVPVQPLWWDGTVQDYLTADSPLRFDVAIGPPDMWGEV